MKLKLSVGPQRKVTLIDNMEQQPPSEAPPQQHHPQKPLESNEMKNLSQHQQQNDMTKKIAASYGSMMMSESRPTTTPTVTTQRPAYDQHLFDKTYAYEPPPGSPYTGMLRTARRGWRSTRSLCSLTYFFNWLLLEHFPMIDWVRQYDARKMLVPDILSGLTCGIMQVPQGMAYGLLSAAGPISGLYTAFYPVVVYSAFASSRHVSVASFAVLAMLTASVIRPNTERVKKIFLQRATLHALPGTALVTAATASLHNITTNATALILKNNSTLPFDAAQVLYITDDAAYTNFVIFRLATAVCLCCGILLLACGVFRLGFIANYLSDSLIAGFCAGAAVHIATTQFFPAVGISSSNPSGWLMLYYSYKDFFTKLKTGNWYTAGLSAICIFLLYTVKTYINANPRMMKRTYGIPIPMELILVVATTLLSYLVNGPKLAVKTVGHIPVGIIGPKLPDISIAGSIFSETIIISFVIMALTVSIGRVLAKKNDTPIDASTELRALGLANIAGAFFDCIPTGCAMARTMVLAGIGAPTQLTNFIGCAIVFIVLQWIGKLLEPLPSCVLAAIVIVAVKPLFMTITECWRLMHVSWVDASIYLVTFIAILLGEVGNGIVIGLGYSIFTIVIRTQYPHVYVLGRLRNTELYKPLGEYRSCAEIYGIRILRISAPIYFANVDYLRTRCLELVFNTDKYRALAAQKRVRRRSQAAQTHSALIVKGSSGGGGGGGGEFLSQSERLAVAKSERQRKIAQYNAAAAAENNNINNHNNMNENNNSHVNPSFSHTNTSHITMTSADAPTALLKKDDDGNGMPGVVVATIDPNTTTSMVSMHDYLMPDDLLASAATVNTVVTGGGGGGALAHHRRSLQAIDADDAAAAQKNDEDNLTTNDDISRVLNRPEKGLQNYRPFSMSTLPPDIESLHNNNHHRASRSGGDDNDGSTSLTSAATTHNGGGGGGIIRQRKSSRKSSAHSIQISQTNPDDAAVVSAMTATAAAQRPKMSLIGEIEERQRFTRPPRLSVVFAGVLDHDVEFDASRDPAGADLMMFASNAAAAGGAGEAMAPHHVILDCSSVSFVDSAGVTMLVSLVRECRKKAATQVFLAHCPRNVREQIRRNVTVVRNDLPDTSFFPTIHDAVVYGIARTKEEAVRAGTVNASNMALNEKISG